jgi:hypothetical protein
LGNLPARKGRPKLEWFDQYVELMTEIAGHVGIEVRTMGKLDRDPHQTPFTALVFGFETLLPEDARSDTLGTCAQRIQRSRRRRKTLSGSLPEFCLLIRFAGLWHLLAHSNSAGCKE